jgi:cation transport protein ChaC
VAIEARRARKAAKRNEQRKTNSSASLSKNSSSSSSSSVFEQQSSLNNGSVSSACVSVDFANLTIDKKVSNVILNTKDKGMWIFGYGSLIWRPDFPHLHSRWGYVTGWKRRFYQISTDHRGTKSTPGRVVTLCRNENHSGSASSHETLNDKQLSVQNKDSIDKCVSCENFKCTCKVRQLSSHQDKRKRVYGKAYFVEEKDVEGVLKYLHERETCGFQKQTIKVHLEDFDQSDASSKQAIVETVDAICYVGNEQASDEFIGHLPIHQIAKQISISKGASGSNAEYLFKLVEALQSQGIHRLYDDQNQNSDVNNKEKNESASDEHKNMKLYQYEKDRIASESPVDEFDDDSHVFYLYRIVKELIDM